MSPQLTTGLWYERETASSSVAQVARPRSCVVEPVLRFRRGSLNAKRMHVDLVLLGGERSVDVSFHPAATVDFVGGQALRRGFDANGWTGALLRALVDDGRRWGSWTPAGDSTPTLGVLGGLTHPLLGSAYDAGAEPAPEIPRWASPALGESAVTACAMRLFGAGAASRSVARSLATLLLRPVVAWWQLAVGVAAATVLGSDDLALVLAAGPTEPRGPGGEGLRLPTAEDLAMLRTGLSLLEPARAKRLVLDTVGSAGERGVERLAAALQSLNDVRDDVRWPPPVRLVDLEAVCLRASAIDPTPPASPPARLVPAPPPAPRRRPARPEGPDWATPRNAPSTRTGPPSPSTGFRYGAAARGLDRVAIGDLELVLPRTPDELALWGRMLDNCLSGFAAAVADQVTTIVGVRQRGALLAALEVRLGEHRVVQFLGPGNRRPSVAVSATVLRHLTACGVIR